MGVPHTVQVKILYRVAGQDCRCHIIRAAGLITEVRLGAGPVVVTNRGALAVASGSKLPSPRHFPTIVAIRAFGVNNALIEAHRPYL